MNHILKPTRTITKFYNKSSSYKTSATLLDVIISNKLSSVENFVINCPFSDHCFIGASFNIKATQNKKQITVWKRNLSPANLKIISGKILLINFDKLENMNLEDKWIFFKTSILNILDTIAPFKNVQVSLKKKKFPWFDKELKDLSIEKEKVHSRAKISKSSQDWCDLKNIVARFKKLYRLKLKQFFSILCIRS